MNHAPSKDRREASPADRGRRFIDTDERGGLGHGTFVRSGIAHTPVAPPCRESHAANSASISGTTTPTENSDVPVSLARAVLRNGKAMDSRIMKLIGRKSVLTHSPLGSVLSNVDEAAPQRWRERQHRYPHQHRSGSLQDGFDDSTRASSLPSPTMPATCGESQSAPMHESGRPHGIIPDATTAEHSHASEATVNGMGSLTRPSFAFSARQHKLGSEMVVAASHGCFATSSSSKSTAIGAQSVDKCSGTPRTSKGDGASVAPRKESDGFSVHAQVPDLMIPPRTGADTCHELQLAPQAAIEMEALKAGTGAPQMSVLLPPGGGARGCGGADAAGSGQDDQYQERQVIWSGRGRGGVGGDASTCDVSTPSTSNTSDEAAAADVNAEAAAASPAAAAAAVAAAAVAAATATGNHGARQRQQHLHQPPLQIHHSQHTPAEDNTAAVGGSACPWLPLASPLSTPVLLQNEVGSLVVPNTWHYVPPPAFPQSPTPPTLSESQDPGSPSAQTFVGVMHESQRQRAENVDRAASGEAADVIAAEALSSSRAIVDDLMDTRAKRRLLSDLIECLSARAQHCGNVLGKERSEGAAMRATLDVLQQQNLVYQQQLAYVAQNWQQAHAGWQASQDGSPSACGAEACPGTSAGAAGSMMGAGGMPKKSPVL